MKKLLFFILVTSFVACHKNKEESKLPKPLQEEIAKIQDCTCDPQLEKISFENRIYYVMSWHGPTCYIPPVYYDENGKRIEAPVMNAMNAPQYLGVVWRCRNYIR